MNNKVIKELHLALEAFANDFEVLEEKSESLLKMKNDFVDHLTELSLAPSDLTKDNELLKVAEQVNTSIIQAVKSWSADWDARAAMRELSNSYADRVILLVFGKVNAGKSSFSNTLASFFSSKDRKYFFIADGAVSYKDEPFAEGVTETTASIQGIELGDNLVLLDSPGLHSVTEENGAKTRLFIDSADVVLWLSPSTSPGQIQELKDLKFELESGKPLLPVITRSDQYLEDIDDNDEFIRRLVNKSSQNRKMQQDDVQNRAQQNLGNNVEVKNPLSISVHCYRTSDGSEPAFNESGISALISNISEIIEDARIYKGKKAQQQVVNYLEKTVKGSVEENLEPKVDDLKKLMVEQRKTIKKIKENSFLDMMAELHEFIPEWANQFKDSKDLSGFSKKLTSYLQDELQKSLNHSIEGFIENIEPAIIAIEDMEFGEFSDIEISYEESKGNGSKVLISSALGLVGGAIGFLAGPLGGIVGGLVGGVVGDYLGDGLVDKELITSTIGVSSEAVATTTLNNLEKKLPEIIDNSFNNWEESLINIDEFIAAFSKEIKTFKNEINRAKEEMQG